MSFIHLGLYYCNYVYYFMSLPLFTVGLYYCYSRIFSCRLYCCYHVTTSYLVAYTTTNVITFTGLLLLFGPT